MKGFGLNGCEVLVLSGDGRPGAARPNPPRAPLANAEGVALRADSSRSPCGARSLWRTEPVRPPRRPRKLLRSSSLQAAPQRPVRYASRSWWTALHRDHLRQRNPFGSMLRTGDFGWCGTSSNMLTAQGPRGPVTCCSAEHADESTAQDSPGTERKNGLRGRRS